MYTQFFGNFLLEKNLITKEQLLKAIESQKGQRLRLGTLAIHAGLLTAAEVNHIHGIQTHKNKRFGEIAMELGYLSPVQIDKLLAAQTPSYLQLSQALVDLNYLSAEDFESAMEEYQLMHQLSDLDFSNEQYDKVALLIARFFTDQLVNDPGYYASYITLFFNNIVRFIGQDFAPSKVIITKDLDADHMAVQRIKGKYNMITGIAMDEETLIAFASRYAGEEFYENDEFTQAALEDFLNLHNGLFAVNASNSDGVELELEPPTYGDEELGDLEFYVIPLDFPFGRINFFFTSLDNPA